MWVKTLFAALQLTCLLLPATVQAAEPTGAGENLAGFYAREGNGGSPAKAAGNNIYIKFFSDRWLAILFVPYPYATGVDSETIAGVLDTARAQTASASFLKGEFGLLDEAATVQIERYGYYQDRIAFECGALSACTIKISDDSLELIKPGVINEHIIRYNHVDVD